MGTVHTNRSAEVNIGEPKTLTVNRRLRRAVAANGGYQVQQQPETLTPVAVTAKTCMTVLGLPWRVALRIAVEHQVPILGSGRTRMLVISQLLEALEAAGRIAQPPPPIEELDDASQREIMLRELGLKVAR